LPRVKGGEAWVLGQVRGEELNVTYLSLLHSHQFAASSLLAATPWISAEAPKTAVDRVVELFSSIAPLLSSVNGC